MAKVTKKSDTTPQANEVPDFDILPLTRKLRSYQKIRYNQMVNKLPDDVIAAQSDLEAYLQIVSQTTLKGLTTSTGKNFPLPNGTASIDEHVEAFLLFQECDVRLTDVIEKRVSDFNAPPASREMLPDNELTEDERNDPSS